MLEVRVVTQAGGGPDKTILTSPRFLATRGYRAICAYMHPPEDAGFAQLRRRAEAAEAPLVSIPDRGPLDLKVLRRLLDLCRAERVAIWHGHDYKSNLFGLLLRPFWPMRLVTTVHGWVRHTQRTPLYYGLDRLCLPHYDRVICVSDDLRTRCLAAGVPAERCLLIENAIDLDQFSRDMDAIDGKRQLGLPAGRFVIGAVGRLSAEKGFDVLIRAVDRLLADGHDVGLVIAGEGDERRALEGLIAALGRSDRIQLLGYRPDTRAVYQALDAYALSSLREGLPNALLEAMALEVPVVATSIAGVPRLVCHEQNGLLVEPGSVDGLVEALSRLIASVALRDSLRREARRTIEERYDFAVRMDRFRAVFDELLGRTSTDAIGPPCPVVEQNTV